MGDFVDVANMLPMFRARAARALERIARIRESDCPRCELGCDIAIRCTSRGDASPADDGLPVCRWADTEAHAAAELVRVQDRRARLIDSGCDDQAILRELPPLAHPPDPAAVPEQDRWAARLFMAGAVDMLVRGASLRVLMLMGPTGAGKSFAAGWVVAARGGMWIPAVRALTPQRWREESAGYERASVLVLDDAGTEGDSWPCDNVRALLVTRLSSDRTTVVTTNKSREEFVRVYGDRVRSRLQDAARVRVIDPQGAPDLRVALRRGAVRQVTP